MKVLFLSRWFPIPANNGSKLRVLNLLKGLAGKHEVTLLSFADAGADLSSPKLSDLCAEVCTVPWQEFDPHSRGARMGFLSAKPRSIIDTFSLEMAREITQTLSRKKYDLVIASQLPMAAYYPYYKDVPALFEELELGSVVEDSRHASGWNQKIRHELTWFKLRNYLGRLLDYFEAVTVVSEKERDLVRRHFPSVKKILVAPNCINLADYQGVQVEVNRSRLVFTGSFRYHANYEAMRWFVSRVFPHVLEQRPDAELVITGDHAGLPLPSERNISLPGYVEDVAGLIAGSAVALAPLLSGGGTRLKILEAMAIGTPVVATSKGAEGLEARNGEHLIVADDPAEFARCILRLLNDEAQRCGLIERAGKLVREKYDWSATLPEYLRFAESLAGAGTRS